MYKQKLKGLWIPAEILLNTELTDKEKLILSIIEYLSVETGYCFATNKYISSIVNITNISVSRIISSLKHKKHINVELNYKLGSKEIEKRKIIPINENVDRYKQKQQYTINKNIKQSNQNCKAPISKNDKDIINIIKNKNNYNKKKYEGREYSEEFLETLYANV